MSFSAAGGRSSSHRSVDAFTLGVVQWEMIADPGVIVMTDHDVATTVDMAAVVEICDGAIVADLAEQLTAPARHVVDFGPGRVAFTVGGVEDAVGFRSYETFPGSQQDQVVAVWHPSTGKLAGVIVGKLLGAIRTGGLGGAAVDRLAATDAGVCGVIGSGLQARTQLLACAKVRDLSEVRVFSRSEANREAFVAEMSQRIGLDIEAVGSAADAAAGADIVLVATTSPSPVISADDLAPEAHLSTVGPKFLGHSELGPDVAEAAGLIATDSPQQIRAQGEAHFLAQNSAAARVVHLGLCPERPAGVGRTLYLSAGLAGTEVLVADSLLRTVAAA